VGTAVGDLAPDFRLIDIGGQTITRAELAGGPALLWFTTSYCVPCQEGAVALKRVLARTGTEDEIRMVMVFVDPGEPAKDLEWWKERFGAPDWSYALATRAMVTDYRLQYLDTKYLLDGDGIIRAADFLPLDEDAWAGHLREVAAG
jgi:thiol-disulfide isomerase/thioredoxin